MGPFPAISRYTSVRHHPEIIRIIRIIDMVPKRMGLGKLCLLAQDNSCVSLLLEMTRTSACKFIDNPLGTSYYPGSNWPETAMHVSPEIWPC